VRRKPYAVILFDEIEKAHSDVFNILLQILDDGRLTDGQGRTVDFRNSIIIMTSNIGAQMIFEHTSDDLEAIKDDLMKLLQSYFRPEFLNRLDEIILFHRLNREQIKEIVQIQLKKLSDRLKDKRINIHFTENAINAIANEGFDPQFGARPLKRVIQKEIENGLAVEIISGNLTPNQTINIDYENGGFKMKN
jgi:ATP-dependent Clp protease ATP-binding subunit ClpB